MPTQPVSGDHNIESPTCAPISGFDHSDFGCYYEPILRLVVIENLTESTVDGTISFTVSGYVNPITTSQGRDLVLTTRRADGGGIDQGTTYYMPEPYEIPVIQVEGSTTGEVGELTGLLFTLILPFPVEGDDC